MKPAAGQEVRHLSPDQKQIVDRVEAAKIKLGYVNDAEFIRDHIVGSKQQGRMSDSTYRRLREDVYTGQPSEHIEHLAAIAEKLEDMIFVQTKRPSNSARSTTSPSSKPSSMPSRWPRSAPTTSAW